MADWTTIPNSAVDGDSPVTQTLIESLRDNPIAITEAAAGAPQIQTAAIADGAVTNDKILDGTISPTKLYPAAVGDLVDSSSIIATGLGTWAKAKEIQIVRGGSYRISFDVTSGSAQIYRNGTAVGTMRTSSSGLASFSEDIGGWSPGDLLQIYGNNILATSSVSNLKVKASFIYNGNVTLE